METLFIVLSFIGVFAAGFFACMLITFYLTIYKYERRERKRKMNEGGDFFA